MAMLAAPMLVFLLGSYLAEVPAAASSGRSLAKHRHKRHMEVSRIAVPHAQKNTVPLPAAALRDYSNHWATHAQSARSNRTPVVLPAASTQAILAPVSTAALDEATLSGLPGYDVLPTDSTLVALNVDQKELDAATESAEAVANAAEADASEGDAEVAPTNAPPQASLSVVQTVAQSHKQSNITATQEGAVEDDGDDEDDDDGDDDSDANETETLTASEPKPGDELESLTPQGEVDKARQELQDNLHQQAAIAVAIADQGNDTDFDKRVDDETGVLAAETQTKAMATVLGSMRKEMRKFASPFYMEHLISEQRQLKASELELEAALQKSEARLQGRVLESHYQSSSAGLRGGETMLTAGTVTVPANFPPRGLHSAATWRTRSLLAVAAHTMAVFAFALW